MPTFLIAYLGGMLTILSPCILPVVPFVFARAEQPFLRYTLPMLVGLVLTFSLVATLGAVGGTWAIEASHHGRYVALALLTLFGLTLLSAQVASAVARPLMTLADRLLPRLGAAGPVPTFGYALMVGVATGLVWTPCAGPILGLVLAGAFLHGAQAHTTVLLMAYAAGAATSLALALAVGGRILGTLKRSLRAGAWIRRGLGAAVLGVVAAVTAGADTGLLAMLPGAQATQFEQTLVSAIHASRPTPATSAATTEAAGGGMMRVAAEGLLARNSGLPDEGRLPSLDGAIGWLNAPPLTSEQLRGKVVVVDFWTYSCINCIRTLPYIRAWADKYKDQGLVVIGVHTPEFAFEKRIGNVRQAVEQFKIRYPVAVDSDFRIWRAFGNSYWPALYFIDASGQIRHHQFGEGNYEQSEAVIQALLKEAGTQKAATGPVRIDTSGAQAAPDLDNLRSRETYIGYQQASSFASPEGLRAGAARDYTIPEPRLNRWGLSGNWTVEAEQATLNRAGGGIAYRFRARDLHLVLGPGADGKPVRLRVMIDGKAPGADHGTDIDADGNGTVTQTKLYQLVRQSGTVGEHTLDIRFLDPGVQAFVFTFG
ncbi:cytochrome c biogenesis protein DipZ [Cupriavidus sp. CuC1]|uniref:cytochrome c biogenesis protein DipZ n=1 Tax=Cupriavidus sp. CuC1 TaxID=3373131 RepID=UPI0037D546CB